MSEHKSVVQYFYDKDAKISEWTDDEIILFHTVVHSSVKNSSVGKLVDVHNLVVTELNKRKIGHSNFDNLDEVENEI